MNVLAFTLIGLQLRPLMESLSGAQREEYLLIAIAVLAAVILVRIAWVMTFNSGIRFKNYYWGMKLPRPMAAPTARGGFVIAWSGMRGIVTLAAALSLPASFPYRDLAQLIAFAVVFGTLVFQGLTLGPLIRLMKLPPDNQVQRETDIAREAALRAALGAIDGDQSAGANALRTEYCALLSEFSVDETERDFLRHETLRIKAVDAARDAISKLRRTGDIGDDAYRAIEEALDRSELYARRHTD
jgi:CPA1 family monovalent cation:H+ antiporter